MAKDQKETPLKNTASGADGVCPPEHELKENSRVLLESGAFGVITVSPKGAILSANKIFCEMLGYSEDELKKTTFQEITYPETVKKDVEALQKMIKGELKFYKTEKRYIKKNKELLWVRISVASIFDCNGKIHHQLTIIENIDEQKKAEEQIEKYRGQFEKFFQKHDAIFLLMNGNTGKILNANEAALHFYGYSLEKIRSLKIGDINMLKPDELDAERQRAIKEERKYFIVPHRLANGEIRTVEVHTTPVVLDNETCLFSVIHDITERKKTEQALKESEEKFRDLVEKSLVGVYLIQDDLFQYVNPKLAEIFGYDNVGELNFKKGPKDLVLPQDWPLVKENLRKRIQGEIESIHYEFLGQKKDGKTTSLEVYGSKITYKNKPAVIGMLLDIGERKKAEQALKESEEKFRTLVDSSPDCIKMFDLDGKLIYLSPGGRQEHKLEKEADVVGWDYASSVEKEHIPEFKKAFEKAKNGETSTIEIKHVSGKSRAEWCLMTLTPIKNAKGEVINIFGVSRDISERKKTERAVGESEEKFRILAERSPVMVFINKGGKVIYANDKCEEITGYKKEDFYSPKFDFMSLIAPEDKEKVGVSFKAHMEGKETAPYEYNLVLKNGSILRALMATRLITYQGEPAILGIVSDLTEHFEFERKIKESSETIKALINAPIDAAYLLDKDGRILITNEAGAKRLQKSIDELVGSICYDFFPAELARSRKKQIDRVFDSGKQLFFEDERGGRALYNSVYPVFGEKGKVVKVALYVADITERKKADEDLRQSKEEIEARAKKLEKMNRLMVGRELKMAELKRQINDLQKNAGNK
jgi:PAS domain S-box-containing protein